MSAAACTTPPVSSLALPGPSRTAAVPPAVRRGAWQLAAGQALTLTATGPSVLRVRQGRLWITLTATTRHGSDDLVLGPGESLAVPAGQRLVMEPWDGYGATYGWDAQD
jgi:hypothetical protein